MQLAVKIQFAIISNTDNLVSAIFSKNKGARSRQYNTQAPWLNVRQRKSRHWLNSFQIFFRSFGIVFRGEIFRSVILEEVEKLAQYILDQLYAGFFNDWSLVKHISDLRHQAKQVGWTVDVRRLFVLLTLNSWWSFEVIFLRRSSLTLG